MKIFQYLCDPIIRKELSNYLMVNVPEIFECGHSKGPNSYLIFNEYNHPSGVGKTYEKWKKPYPHVFTLVMGDSGGTVSSLWDDILPNTKVSDFHNNQLGFKMGVSKNNGLLYPNLDIKIQNLIIEFIRDYKLNIIIE